MRVKELFTFMKERHAIYKRRAAGKPKPWTKNPILQQYRFCNVYRERDAVTKWIAENWRKPRDADPHLWFALVIARLLNLPASLEFIGYPGQWDGRAQTNFLALKQRRAAGHTIFNGAYIVSTNGVSMDKIEYLYQRVLTPLWAARGTIESVLWRPGVTLEEVHQVFMLYDGLGSFMAAQVVADLKYVAPLSKAPDWHTWAASGPGSRRGLNRVCDTPVDAPWREALWLEVLQILHDEITPLVIKAGMPPLHAQDLQNCLCEWDKFERVRLGEGTPKQKYDGGA